jgi:cytochrome c-type biogenesis protein CcmF
MTEAGIDPGFLSDTYISMGEPLSGDAWAVRLHYKPFVRWIWFGGLLMAFGGVLSALDLRYRRRKVDKASAEQTVIPSHGIAD